LSKGVGLSLSLASRVIWNFNLETSIGLEVADDGVKDCVQGSRSLSKDSASSSVILSAAESLNEFTNEDLDVGSSQVWIGFQIVDNLADDKGNHSFRNTDVSSGSGDAELSAVATRSANRRRKITTSAALSWKGDR